MTFLALDMSLSLVPSISFVSFLGLKKEEGRGEKGWKEFR